MIPARRSAGRVRAGAPAATLLSGLLVATLLTACGSTPGSPAAVPSAPSPGATASAGAPASGGPSVSPGAERPSATPFPGSVIEGLLVLGRADQDIQAAGADLGAATANEDLEAMWGAADGLAAVLAQLPAQVDRLRDYPATAELVQRYDEALPTMTEGATGLRDAITDQDAAGIASASKTLSDGLASYGEVRPILAPLVEQAFLMQRLLVK